jgi:hypothetical protein
MIKYNKYPAIISRYYKYIVKCTEKSDSNISTKISIAEELEYVLKYSRFEIILIQL